MSDIEYAELQHKRLHFLGIGGRGMSAMAQIAQQFGAQVSGCDKGASYTTVALQEAGIPIEIGHNPAHLANADALIYVPAVTTFEPDNAELAEARNRGLVNMTWQELLGKWAVGKCSISVSGVHGKGTTTTLLSYMFLDAGLDPSCFVGAVVPRFNSSFRLGQSPYFINEADEYNHNFWHIHPRIAIVTSIEYEHPEFFPDLDAMLYAFEGLIRRMDMHSEWPFLPTAIINAGNAGCRLLLERLRDWPGHIITYAVESPATDGTEQHTEADYVAYDVQEDGLTHFHLRTHHSAATPAERVFHYSLPGIYNVENALAALAAAHAAGIPLDSALHTLENFEGAKRRFEVRYQGTLQVNEEARDVVLIDDYAHHPTAIALTLAAARKRFPGRRVVLAYQPDMFTRTKALFDDFVTAFQGADVVILTDINPGREQDTGLVHARDLVAAIARGPHFAQSSDQAMYGGDLSNVEALLRENLRSGDVAIVMGSGTIYTITKHLLHEA
ncbi:MAG TPA: UDP-N-acetylmuramate--L-alanine ligase [Ktedonobacteraceae bacterium]|nr:UDP-N-acetylmuramate--L-alanine ligase [Ktedonobacteraceae bacterium]